MSEQSSNHEDRRQDTAAEPGFRFLRGFILLAAGLLLLVLVLLGSLSALLSTERGSRWLLDTGTGFIPADTLQLQFSEVQGTFLHGLSLYNVRLDIGDNTLGMTELQSRWNPFTLLSGEFILDNLTLTKLSINWQGNEQDDVSDTPTDLSQTLEDIFPLPVNIRVSEFMLDGADIHFNGMDVGINTLRFAGLLRGREVSLDALHFDGIDALLDGDITVTLGGNYAVSGSLDWQYNNLAGGQAGIIGDLNTLELQHRLHEPMALDSQGSVTLGVADMLNARAQADEELPLSVNLVHTLAEPRLPFEGLEGLQFANTRIATIGWLDRLRIEGSSDVTSELLPGPPIETSLQWQAVYSGVTVNIEDFVARTASGTLQSSGSVELQDNIRVTLAVTLTEDNPANYLDTLPEMLSIRGIGLAANIALELTDSGPRGTVSVQEMEAILNDYALAGDGVLRFDGDVLEIDDLNLQSDDSALHFSGRFADTIEGRLSINAPALEVFYPPLSGALVADADIRGSLDDLQIDIDASATDLHYGEVRIDRIELQGETRSNNNQIINARISHVLVGGQLMDSVSFRIDGQLDEHSLTLQVSGEPGNLSLAATGGFNEGEWRGQLLNSEVTSAAGRWQQVQGSELTLSAESVQIGQTCWLQGEASLCLDANLDDREDLLASLALQSYPLALINGAQGRNIVQSFDGDTGNYPYLPSDVNIPFSLPPDLAVLGHFNANADIRGSLADMEQLSLQFTAELQGLEAYLRSEPLPDPDPDPEINGNGANDWLIEQFLWEEAVFTGGLDNGGWTVDGRMAFFQRDVSGSGMAMRGNTSTNLSLDPDNNLNGRVELDFDDLAWIEAIAPQLQNAVGSLNGTINISGTLEQPGLGADINLRDGGFNVPAIGLELRALNVTLSSSDTETFNLNGRAESGSGHIELNADILRPLAPDRHLELTLQGENFNIANMAEVTMDISPNLRVSGNQLGMNVRGNLAIPVLDARITELPETAIDVSSDAVLVSQRDEDAPVRNTATADRGPLSDIPITAEVRVTLGDDVRFEGFGLTAQVIGMLDISQRAGSAPLAYGELEVIEGNFQTYGRTLTIEQGKLLFFGPFDNPAVDIRAVRQVEHMRVGVQMNGTIRNLRSHLFSTPALPDGDIIAVMITGRPLAEIGQNQQDNNALVGAITSLGISQSGGITDAVRGQLGLDTLAIDSSGDVNDASLTLGKYITPRIFIRYAVGLFETENSLAIDYTMTDNIKLEAKSGTSQSLDVTYTLER